MATTLQEEKASLRRRMRAERHQISSEASREAGERMAVGLRTIGKWREARCVLLFQALVGEPDLSAVATEAVASGKRVVYPAVHGRELTLWEVVFDGGWRVGAFGIKEPDPGLSVAVAVEEIDLALLPGLAFDRKGGRLGQGKGFYDRLLKDPAWRAWTVGAAFRWQTVARVPCEDHDVRMKSIIWDNGVWEVCRDG